MAIVGIKAGIIEICKLCAGEGNPPLSKECIRQYVGEGMPKAGRNEYDVYRCLLWCLGRARKASARKETENTDGTISGVMSERKRLLKNKADREELEMAVLQKDLISIATYKKSRIELILNTKARILAVPARVASKLVGETSRILIQGIIEKELKEALSALAEGK